MGFKLYLKKEKDFDRKFGEGIPSREKRMGREGKPRRNILWLASLIDVGIIFKVVMSSSFGKLQFALERGRGIRT